MFLAIWLRPLLWLCLLGSFSMAQAEGTPPAGMVQIPAGYYKPFYKTKGVDSVRINTFYMDVYAVTNKQFLAFVKANPQWARSKVTKLLADDGYLRHWKSDFNIGDPGIENSPVTNVSWFAAKAYCKWVGKRLPTVNEWEYAAEAPLVWPQQATGKNEKSLILNWYSQPNPQKYPPVGSLNRNAYGLYDLFASVWEWVADFNSIVIPNDPRGGLDLNSFCGSGAFGTLDPEDYATFMRYAMRNSLKASYTVENLGFRCVKDIQ